MPERKALALLHKITATWCTPCGTWGWSLAEALREQTSGQAIYLGLFASASKASQNAEFYNQTAATLAHAFTFSGYPSFGINGLPFSESSATGGIDANQVEADVLNAADAFGAQDPPASAAGYYSMDGDQIMVQAKVRFWEAMEGAFYWAAYIVEDNAMNVQSGRSLSGNEVPHHDVLRASMSPEGAWGTLIDSGQLSAYAEYTADFSYTLTDSSWNRDNLKVYLVLWSKEQEQYRFVNAAVAESNPVAVARRDSSVLNIQPFPNPAENILHVTVFSKSSKSSKLSITNINGVRATEFRDWTLTSGLNHRTVDISGLAKGLYILTLRTAGHVESIKFSR